MSSEDLWPRECKGKYYLTLEASEVRDRSIDTWGSTRVLRYFLRLTSLNVKKSFACCLTIVPFVYIFFFHFVQLSIDFSFSNLFIIFYHALDPFSRERAEVYGTDHRRPGDVLPRPLSLLAQYGITSSSSSP